MSCLNGPDNYFHLSLVLYMPVCTSIYDMFHLMTNSLAEINLSQDVENRFWFDPLRVTKDYFLFIPQTRQQRARELADKANNIIGGKNLDAIRQESLDVFNKFQK